MQKGWAEKVYLRNADAESLGKITSASGKNVAVYTFKVLTASSEGVILMTAYDVITFKLQVQYVLRAEFLQSAGIRKGKRHYIGSREDTELTFKTFPFCKGGTGIAVNKG